jgi:acetyltransferase AlgX (SGNH hydrolase-like protein)
VGRRRDLLGKLALAGGSLALTLAGLELAARAIVRRRESQPHTTRGSIIAFDPRLGWAKPPLAAGWLHRPEYHVHLEINSHGLRGPDRDYGKPPDTHRILLLGDSFTEGFAVREEATVRAGLESILRRSGCGAWEVINAGTMGYGTDQEYLFFHEEGRRYQPDIVVLLFFYNDLNGNLATDGKPYFTVEEDRLVLHGSPMSAPRAGEWTRRPEPRPLRIRPWFGSMALRLLSDRTAQGNPRLHRLLARAGLVEPARTQELPADFWPFGPGHRDEVAEMWRRTEAILSALRADVESSAARFAVFYVPDETEIDSRVAELTRQRYGMGPRWWRAGRVFDRLRGFGVDRDITLLDPRFAFQDARRHGIQAYFPEDGHWTEEGNRVAAEFLARALRREGWATCASP